MKRRIPKVPGRYEGPGPQREATYITAAVTWGGRCRLFENIYGKEVEKSATRPKQKLSEGSKKVGFVL